MNSLSSAWEVLVLFLIPIGGGIPAGVLLAKARGLSWIVMAILYLISDVILAFIFEPIMMLAAKGAKRSSLLAKWGEAFQKSLRKTTANYGSHLGPLALILVAFGVDPMTGRTAAAAAGHGFVSGWTLAIAGDMIYFALIMASTLWLNNLLGDGTLTTVIILVGMMVIPALVRRIREWRKSGREPGTV